MKTIVALLVAATLLAACNPLAVFRPGEAAVLENAWFSARRLPVLTARYCYRTLAEVDCHTRPLASQDSRRVGWFDAPSRE